MKKLKLDSIITKFRNLIVQGDDLTTLKPLGVIIVLLGITALMLSLRTEHKIENQVKKRVSIDTYIPKGESLVPIKVANFESLNQIIGDYGVVDLYTTPLHPGQKPDRVGYAVKLIRSPLNPEHFSVLVPIDKVARIVSYSGEYTVSVRNPALESTRFAQEKKKAIKRIVTFEDGSS